MQRSVALQITGRTTRSSVARPVIGSGTTQIHRPQPFRSAMAQPFAGNVRSRQLLNTQQNRIVCRGLFGLGVPELVVIAGVAALIFGPSKLPELGKGLGKTVKSFQTAAKEFETELKQAASDGGADAAAAAAPKAEEAKKPEEAKKAE